MIKEYTFYGTKISDFRRGELPGRIYEAFVKEIISGRWSIGERLPSYEQLYRDTGISRTSIDVAMKKLEVDGYIERVHKKGIFLKTTHPGKHAEVGTLALVLEADCLEIDPYSYSTKTESFGLLCVDQIR